MKTITIKALNKIWSLPFKQKMFISIAIVIIALWLFYNARSGLMSEIYYYKHYAIKDDPLIGSEIPWWIDHYYKKIYRHAIIYSMSALSLIALINWKKK